MAPLNSAAGRGYTLLQKLNSGSFGDVYLAEDVAGKPVAIKILYGDDWQALEDELRFCKWLDHPNIVKTLDVLEIGDQHWVVSEYCENGDLFGAILPMEGVGDESRIKKYLSQLVDALVYLHDLDIIHRDIKPENVLINATDDVKLCDFGLSKYETENWESGVGTVAYMAPEVYQLPAHMAVVNRKATDVWSLGCTLFTMLAGMLPWEAPCLQDPEYEAFREQHGRFDRPAWSVDLHQLLWGMLHWDPAKRFTIHEIQKRVRESSCRPWIVAPPAQRNGLTRALSHVIADDELQRPRSPPGTHGVDFVVFRDDGDTDGGAVSESDNNMSASAELSLFANRRQLLPPRRRTRYNSESCEIEFNPYLQCDSPVVFLSRAPSNTSSSGTSEEEGSSWFMAGAMSFNTLPRFDDLDKEGHDGVSPVDVQRPVAAAERAAAPRFVLGDEDDEDEDDFGAEDGDHEDNNEVDEEHVNGAVSSRNDRDNNSDQGIGGSLTDDVAHIRWGDLDRDMSFSVLPRFDSLTLVDDRPDPKLQSHQSQEYDGDSSEDSGVERDVLPHSRGSSSRPISVPVRRLVSRYRA